MRKVKVGITGIFLLISGLLMAQNVNRTPQGVKVNVAEGNFNAEVIFYSPSIVRIVKYPSVKDQMPDKESLSVTLVPEQTKIDFKEQGDDVRLKTSDMIVTRPMERYASPIQKTTNYWQKREPLLFIRIRAKPIRALIKFARPLCLKKRRLYMD